MKRVVSVLLAMVLTALMTTVAFAAGGKAPSSGHYSGIAEFDDGMVEPGESVTLDVDYFYGKWTVTEKEWDDSKGRDVNVKYTYDNEDEPIVYLEKEYHKVSATWTSGGNYVQSVYFEDGDPYVTIEFKGDVSTADREIRGTIRIKESGIPNRPDVTYECKIQKGALVLQGIDERSRMVSLGDKLFGLPDDYQSKQVRFSHDEDGSYGTFLGDFWSDKTGQQLAEFRVRIIDQSSLYLGISEAANKTVAAKYPDAELRFVNWTARPTFDYEGKLSLYMDPDEFIYGISDDNTLYRLGGTYDEDNEAYVISTKTLASYVISDTQLTVGGSGSTGTSSSGGSSSSTVAPSSSTSPSSSAAPSSVAPSSTAPAPSSSVAPAPSSSAAPSSSSEESSSEPEEQSSEPEDEDPFDPEDEDPFDPDDDEGDDDDERETTAKKKFPLIPVLFGVLGVVVLVCAVIVVGNRNSNSRSRSRRRRYDDDWDD